MESKSLMKVAYLAPELPALSATFVYNEILQLEALGTEVQPFSVHRPSSTISEPRVLSLAAKTINLYSQSKLSVLSSNVKLLLSHPLRYLKTIGLLISDMWQVGLLSRTAVGLGYRMFYGASLAEFLIDKDCDHLHVHFAHIPTDIAMYASSLSNISYSVTAHANDLYERGWLLKQKVARSAFFATISEFNQRYLAEKGVASDKVVIVRCGVTAEQFAQRQEQIEPGAYKIGVIGRLVEKKGIDTLIDAIRLLKEQGQQVQLQIAGSGPLESDLIKQAKTSGLVNHEVTFLGALPHSKVAEFIKSLNIFVLPCKRDRNGDIDGIPVVLMEAMLSGVPVISSEISGIPELVIDDKTGLLIQQNDAQGLANAISRILNEKDLRERLVESAISLVTKEFSLLENTKKLNRLFSLHHGIFRD
jgi:glycosyltransferase involved in cell wall biosynthesis